VSIALHLRLPARIIITLSGNSAVPALPFSRDIGMDLETFSRLVGGGSGPHVGPGKPGG